MSLTMSAIKCPAPGADVEACCASLRREYGVFGLEEYLETKAIIGFG